MVWTNIWRGVLLKFLKIKCSFGCFAKLPCAELSRNITSDFGNRLYLFYSIAQMSLPHWCCQRNSAFVECPFSPALVNVKSSAYLQLLYVFNSPSWTNFKHITFHFQPEMFVRRIRRPHFLLIQPGSWATRMEILKPFVSSMQNQGMASSPGFRLQVTYNSGSRRPLKSPSILSPVSKFNLPNLAAFIEQDSFPFQTDSKYVFIAFFSQVKLRESQYFNYAIRWLKPVEQHLL